MMPRTAVVLGDLDEWRAGLTAAGTTLVSDGAADVIVAPATHAVEAARRGAQCVIVEGRATRALRVRNYQPAMYLPRPRVASPDLLLPLQQRRAAAYGLEHWTNATSRRRMARNRIAAHAVRVRLVPPLRHVVTVGAESSVPRLVAAVREHDIAAEEWLLALGRGDDLSRNVFLLWDGDGGGRAQPSWALKFARVRGRSEPFERDARGLRLAANAGQTVRRHAPGLLRRFNLDGLEASLETAAPGERLRRALESALSRRDARRAVDTVAAWIVELGKTTATDATAVDGERQRLETDVLPAWGMDGELVQTLPRLPGVLQHNDLGTWNVMWSGRDFVVVDWESAREHGLPLWDLAYFLADALTSLARVDESQRVDHMRRLFRGESELSPALFTWLRRGASSLDISADAVGPLVTLGWLHHGLSHIARAEALTKHGARGETVAPAIEQFAVTWMRDPALGADWSAWRA
jgi:hypothetical protein